MWFTVCGTSWLTINSFCTRVAPVCFLVRVCLGEESFLMLAPEESWFDANIAAPAVGTPGSVGYFRLCVLVVSLECVGCLVILGAVSRVVIVTDP